MLFNALIKLLQIIAILFVSFDAWTTTPKVDRHQKFSIIIPIYNTEKFLPECIESVIKQTYKNIEIILVNDGSPGNADEICKKYATLDNRIRYINQKNQGVAIARNNGIAISSGDYVFCVDSDDSIEPNFIKKLLRTFVQTSCDAIVVGEIHGKQPIELPGALPTWAIAVTRDILVRYPDVRFQEHMQPCEDGLFSHKILALTDKVAFCRNAKYFYRVHPASSEQNLTTEKILSDIPKWYKILAKFYDKYNLWKSQKQHLLMFIYNEPYERLMKMPFTISEEKYLFDITHKFIKEHRLKEIENLNIIPEYFLCFLSSDSYLVFKCKIMWYNMKMFSKDLWCIIKFLVKKYL